MSGLPGKWGDLAPRVLSGVAMALVGFGLIYWGGLPLLAGLIVLGGLGMWELHRMLGGGAAGFAGAISAIGVLAVGIAQLWVFAGGDPFLQTVFLSPWTFPLLAIALWGGVQNVPEGNRWIYLCYGALFLFAIVGLFYLRIMHGFIFALFIVAIVVATDIAGYFVGRIIGGPKFWPRVSPKKTWSGTAGGWLAAMVTAAILLPGPAPLMVFVIAPLLSLASQLGDIVESAIKRRQGVKDSSDLIPGHGGILDRFDGMAGATALATIAMSVAGGWLT